MQMDGQCLKNCLWMVLSGEKIQLNIMKVLKGYILEVDLEYHKSLHGLHSDLLFLPERMMINKCNELVCNLYGNNKYVVHIIALKQALNLGLVLEKVHWVIKFIQEALFKDYIDMNTELRK